MKEITTRQMAMIKRIAMNVNPLVVKKNKLISKINDLTVEIAEINENIERGLQANKAKNSLQKMQQNNQNSEMKKALKQYQYNLTRSKRGG